MRVGGGGNCKSELNCCSLLQHTTAAVTEAPQFTAYSKPLVTVVLHFQAQTWCCILPQLQLLLVSCAQTHAMVPDKRYNLCTTFP